MGNAPRSPALNLNGAELLQEELFDFEKATTRNYVAPAPGYYLVMLVFGIYWAGGSESFVCSVENGKEVFNEGYYRRDYIDSNHNVTFETKVCLAKLNKGGSISVTSTYWRTKTQIEFYRIK